MQEKLWAANKTRVSVFHQPDQQRKFGVLSRNFWQFRQW